MKKHVVARKAQRKQKKILKALLAAGTAVAANGPDEPANTTLCLVMIVKDESHIIGETLLNITLNVKIDTFCIVDTGSSDNTIAIIREFFAVREVPGVVHERPWVDFALNRTQAIQLAHGTSDFALIFDADDSFTGSVPAHLGLNAAKHSSYMLKFTCPGKASAYARFAIVDNRLPWIYKSVLHEYIESALTDKSLLKPPATIEGDYAIISGRSGNRSLDPLKYEKDAAVLAKALETETDLGLRMRYQFYLAQSYKDCHKDALSIEEYLKRVAMGGWEQEVYISLLYAGNMLYNENTVASRTKALQLWIKAKTVDPERLEANYFLIQHYRIAEDNEAGCAHVSKHPSSKLPKNNRLYNNKLFVSTTVEEFSYDYETSIVMSYVDKRESLIYYNNLFLVFDKMNDNLKRSIIANVIFSLEAVSKKRDFNFEAFWIMVASVEDHNEQTKKSIEEVKKAEARFK